MDYELHLHLDAVPADACALFADADAWPRWQRGLARVTQDEAGRRRLEFAYPGFERVIDEQLVSADAASYVAIYTSDHTWNLCENSFEPDEDGGTLWTQRNEWRFGEVDASDDDQERFEAATLSTMRDFQRYAADALGPAGE